MVRDTAATSRGWGSGAVAMAATAASRPIKAASVAALCARIQSAYAGFAERLEGSPSAALATPRAHHSAAASTAACARHAAAREHRSDTHAH